MPQKMNWNSKSLLAMILAALAGCASQGPTTPEKAVEKRAMEYWQQRVEGRIDKAYLLTTPSFRAARSAQQYKSRFGSAGAIKSAEVAGVTCEAEAAKCSARMKLTVSVALPMVNLNELTTYVDEAWLLEDGAWWRYEEL